MAHKNNEQNLIVPSSEQARINGRKGGLASAKAKKERKTMKEVLTMLLELQAPDKQREKLAEYGIEDSDQTNKTMVAVGLMERASAGDPRAVEVLCELNGEFDKDQDNEIESINVNISTLSDEDIERVNKLKEGLFKNDEH